MHWVLPLLMALVFAVLVGWYCFRQSRRRFRATEVSLIEPGEISEDVVARLKPLVEELLGAGFEFRCARHERKPEGQEAWQVILSAAEGRVWGVVEEVNRDHRVSLESFGADGAVVLTRGGFFEGGLKASEQLLQHRVFESAIEQAEAHAARLEKEDVPLGSLSLDDFFNVHARVANRSVQLMHEAGWLEKKEEGVMGFTLAALPQALLVEVKRVARELLTWKKGKSWLVASKEEVKEPETEEVAGPESGSEVLAEEAVEDGPGEDEELKRAVEEAIAATHQAVEERKPRDEVAEVGGGESEATVESEEAELEPEPEPEVFVPEEEGLPRDWALYQLQQRRASWGYWFSGYGLNALVFASLLGFASWMAYQEVWSWEMVGLGLGAWLIHEAGHALAMVFARRWDESVFFPSLPRPIAAGGRRLTGGWRELLVILAGPVPGLAAGWAMLIDAYLHGGGTDRMLDFALALVVVNGVMLLPFRIFDGGRLFDMLVFRTLPKLRVPVYLLAALVLFASAFFGGGVLAAVAGLVFLAEIPSGKRQAKVLPWVRANLPEEPKEDVDVVTTLRVMREKGMARLLKGKGWAAVVDEYAATSRSRSTGIGGLLVVSLIMMFGLGLPLMLPAVEVGRRSGDWFAMQKQAQSLVRTYQGNRRMIEMGDDTRWDLDFLQNSIEAFQGEPSRAFNEPAVLDTVRKVEWNLASDWVAESPVERQKVAELAVRAMQEEARLAAANGKNLEAFRDLSVALRIILGCEPMHSLTAWVEWTDLEVSLLRDLELISARYPLKAPQAKWFAMALEKAPEPTGKKMASLWLAEGQGVQAFLQGLRNEASKGLRLRNPGTSPARLFLEGMKSSGGLVPVEQMGTRFELAEVWAKQEIVASVPDGVGIEGSERLRLEKLLARVGTNRTFRQVAMSALAVKQGGMRGATEALARLEGEFGLRARLETEGGREALKAIPANEQEGQVLEWVIKDMSY